MTEDIAKQIDEVRRLFAELPDSDTRTRELYAWTLCKAVNKNTTELGGLKCRQILADLMRMNMVRPSLLYSSILWAATKVAATYPEFHFVPFLNMWDPNSFMRPQDYEKGHGKDATQQTSFPSLAERVAKAASVAQAMRPDESLNSPLKDMFGYLPVTTMMVTQVKQADVKGRKVYFAFLISADGTEYITEAHVLRENPATVTPCTTPAKKHYANVGQLYNVVLKKKENGEARIVDAVMAPSQSSSAFPSVVGYVEHIDRERDHIHVYDALSRHFVSTGQRFVNAKEGEFVEFIPVIPTNSKFKSAVILKTSRNQQELLEAFPPREIRITSVNTEKNYCSWVLTDSSDCITEQLSPLQLSQGETSPSFTQGFVNLDLVNKTYPNPTAGLTFKAIIYLKRGKDKQKRPVVRIL